MQAFRAAVLCLALGHLAGVRAQGPQLSPPSRPGPDKPFWSEEIPGEGQPDPNMPGGNDPRGPDSFSDTDVQHYKIDIEIDPPNSNLQGTTTLTVNCVTDGVNQFQFELHNSLLISAVLINAATSLAIPPAGSDGYSRSVTLDRTYNHGESFTLAVSYSGHPTNDGWGGVWWTSSGGAPLVFSMCEPWYNGRWFASKDGAPYQPGDNSDKATAEIFVTAPSNLRSVSNGLLLGVDSLSGNRSRYRWATNYPTAPYLFEFCSAAFNTWTDTYNWSGGTMPAEFNIQPGSDNPSNRAGWDYSLTILDIFGQAYGEYPFTAEKFGIYQFGWGGGMEHQTNIGLCCFDNWIVAHEMAHQWWGDNVTCRYWNDIWLNEGFASYSEALFFERRPGSSGFPDYINWMNNRRPGDYGGSVYVYNTTNVGSIFSGNNVYDKGAWVLHMLRHVVGDGAFFDALIAYRAAYEGGSAVTDDFKSVVEGVSGVDLHSFFDQWVYSPGAPQYDFGWQTTTINSQNYLQLYVTQTQSNSWPTYTMPVDLAVTTSSGSQLTSITNNARAQWYVIPTSGSASAVALDPNQWILHNANQSVAYVNGPPKIVKMSPAPGAVLSDSPANPGFIDITFSEPVNAAAANFSVSGPAGMMAFTLGTGSDLRILRLNFSGPLTWGRYSVSVGDGVTSQAADIALDGEIRDPNQASSLPSGDGIPGGGALLAFTISPSPCPDFNGDHQVALGDLAYLLANFGATGPNMPADFDHNGVVDLGDLAWLLAAFGMPCP